ncbi:MAG TPA: lysophospholipid acyltransferase family protein [Methylomirabilota bacterium]|nr:lysophospholipid acyltransferase family protein [Methylomirabilota bacterium]
MKRWTYKPSPLLDKTLAERLTTFPRDPTLTVYGLRFLGMLFLKAFFACYFRLRIVDRRRIPKSGAFVLVANHGSHLDAVALACALPVRQWHHAYAAAAQDYFFHGIFRSLVAVVFTNALPFDRRDDPKGSLELCADLLHVSHEALIMFPEGTRSPDGRVHEFRVGVGRLVAGTDTPVLPAYIDGAFRAWPRGTAIPKPRRVTIAIGEPRLYLEAPPTKAGATAVAADLRGAVIELKECLRGS